MINELHVGVSNHPKRIYVTDMSGTLIRVSSNEARKLSKALLEAAEFVSPSETPSFQSMSIKLF